MRYAAVLTLVVLGACAHGPITRRHYDAQSGLPTDSLYSRAVSHLDPSNKNGTLDSAIVYLDRYLVAPGKRAHEREAMVLRSLARNSQQLARVEAALQQARAIADNKPRESDNKARDDEYIKEIQRLKDELAAANAELERIKKRLAAPPTKPY
jgi:hypothetical protein